MNGNKQLENDLIELAQKIDKLKNGSYSTYSHYPNDIIDLGEYQAYQKCYKEINKLLKKHNISNLK